MNDREVHESKLQARLEQAKSEIAELREKMEQAKVSRSQAIIDEGIDLYRYLLTSTGIFLSLISN